MAYKKRVPLVQDGQYVNAGVTNQPTRVLQQNIEYLKSIIDEAEIGETVFAREQTVLETANVGQPVYFRASTKQFEPALAAFETDVGTGTVLVAESSQVWGVVHTKHSATSADILLFGFAQLSLAAAVDDAVTAGVYYLSAASAGKLVKQRPPVGVPVLKTDGEGQVFVNPQIRDSLEDHRHYHFELVCLPAGTVTAPTPGDRHVIDVADPDEEGWLPADHASFDGNAPDNAAFGYNIAAAGWKDLWPPLPVQNAYIEMDRGEDKTKAGQGVPLGVYGQCLIDENGIWWLTDCYGDVPWPSTYDSADSETWPESDSSEDIECPRNLYMRMHLYFTRMIFKTSQTVVTSLRAREGSRISVTCYPTEEAAATGDLLLDLDLDFVSGADNTTGAVVFKELDGDTFERGVIVEGVKPAGSNVTITGTLSRRETPGDEETDLIYQGIVSIGLLTDINGKELPVDLIRVTNATLEFYQDLPALGFPPSRQSEIRGKIHIPEDGVPDGTLMKISLKVLGRVDGTLPELEASYRRVAAATSTPQDLPLTDTDLENIEGVAIDADQYVKLESEAFEVAAGEEVFFTVRRLSDGYTGEIHLLDQRGVLTSGE